MRDITERKAVQEELKREKERAEEYLNIAGVMLATINAEENITLINKKGCEILGYNEEELIGRNWFDTIVPQRIRADVRGVFRKLMAGDIKPVEYYENPLLTKNGEERLIAFHNTVIRNKNGQIVGVLFSGDNITERKRAEEALRESEEKFHLFFKAAPDGIELLDSQGNIVDCNKAEELLLGYSREEIIGKHTTMFFHKDNKAIFRKIFPMVNKTGHGQAEIKIIRKDDSTIYIWRTASAIYDENKEFIGVIAYNRDITERKKMEREIEERKIYLEQVLNSELNAVITQDSGYRVIEWNPGAEKMFGYKRKETIGKDLDKLIVNPDSEKYKEATSITKRLLAGESIKSFETIRYRKDGSPVDVLLSGSGIFIEGKLIGAVAVYEDITEKKQLENMQEKMRNLLFRSAKMESIGRLAGGVAHEFNNLLTGIIGFSELLLIKTKDNSSLTKTLEEIKKLSTKAASISSKLITFSRTQKTKKCILDINTLIEKNKDMIKHIAGENIELEFALAPDITKLKVDPEHIEQLIVNIVVNAADAMPEGGKLTIKTDNIVLTPENCQAIPEAHPGKFVCLSIADTGVGMAQETIHRIFEPFFGTKEIGKGMGLGLSAVYGIVKQHRGWIDVESVEGKGSTFNIYLPVYFPKQKDEKKVTTVEKTRITGKRILVVEDEEVVREVVSRVLRKNGYIVFTSSNAKEAMDIFVKEKGKFHLVFTDVVMPEESGLQLVDRILSFKSGTKILFSSGYIDDRAKRISIEKKGFPFLQKPYSLSVMLKTVEDAMG